MGVPTKFEADQSLAVENIDAANMEVAWMTRCESDEQHGVRGAGNRGAGRLPTDREPGGREPALGADHPLLPVVDNRADEDNAGISLVQSYRLNLNLPSGLEVAHPDAEGRTGSNG
jgi:hypothetical protein